MESNELFSLYRYLLNFSYYNAVDDETISIANDLYNTQATVNSSSPVFVRIYLIFYTIN